MPSLGEDGLPKRLERFRLTRFSSGNRPDSGVNVRSREYDDYEIAMLALIHGLLARRLSRLPEREDRGNSLGPPTDPVVGDSISGMTMSSDAI